jgi:hypothetical protein
MGKEEGADAGSGPSLPAAGNECGALTCDGLLRLRLLWHPLPGGARSPRGNRSLRTQAGYLPEGLALRRVAQLPPSHLPECSPPWHCRSEATTTVEIWNSGRVIIEITRSLMTINRRPCCAVRIRATTCCARPSPPSRSRAPSLSPTASTDACSLRASSPVQPCPPRGTASC